MENINENEVVQSIEEKTFDQQIEERRKVIFDEYSKSRKISNIITLLSIILIIGGMILVSQNQNKILPAIGWAILILAFAGMILYYFLSKKKFENNTKEYLYFVNNLLTVNSFNNESFSDIVIKDEKLEANSLAGNGAYLDIVRTVSRNIVEGKFKDLNFKFAEAALVQKGEKKNSTKTVFVGKYFETTNSLKTESNLIITLTGEKPVDVPNGIDNLTNLHTDANLNIYGQEGVDACSLLGNSFVSNLHKIAITDHLMNVVFSIFPGKTLVFLSYDDDTIAIPFDKPFNKDAFESFKNDLTNIFNILKGLGK